jgi:MFS transporter, ACS family, tartrate transporter
MSKQQIFAKCAWRLVPFMMLLYLVNYLDRVNAGFAALTMNVDLDFSPSIFGFGAGVFFLGYLLFQVPANAVLERAGARRTVFCIMAAWGALSAATAFVQDALSFYVMRFFLGVAEAGFFPGMIFYLTLWFPKEYRTRFAATFCCAIPLSGIVGAPLSAAILDLNGMGGLHGWQWLFLVEGLPASMLAFAVFKFLPDGPAQAPWLDEAEKKMIAARLGSETSQEKDLWSALRDPRVIALSLAGFAEGSSLYGTSLWLPQIVKGMGFSTLGTGIVVALCYVVTMVVMVLWGYASDRSGERMRYAAFAWLLAAAGFLTAILAPSDAVVLIGLTLAVAGTLSAIPPFVTIVPTFLFGAAAAGGIALLNAVVSLGGFAVPYFIGVLRERSGDYASGMAMLAVGLVISALIVLALRRVLAAAADATAST